MQKINKDEIGTFEHSSGKIYNTITCPKCEKINYFLIDPKEIKGMICENKACREYLKITER